MKRIHIPKELYKEIVEYCKFNNIETINKEIISLLKKGFNLVKYGSSPFIFNQTQSVQTIETKEKEIDINKKDKIIDNKANKLEKSIEQSDNVKNDVNLKPIKETIKKPTKKGITIIKNN